MALSLWPHVHIVLDRWRFTGETEVPQAMCNNRLFPLYSPVHTAHVCIPIRARKMEERGRLKGTGCLLSPLQTHPVNKWDVKPWIRHSKHSERFQKLAYLCIRLPFCSCLPCAHSNTGFDTNSCHLVQFTSEGKNDVHYKEGKEEGRA